MITKEESPLNSINSFEICVQPSGRSFTAEPGETILAAGIRQGVGLPYGCKDGACGSCKCMLLEGSVVHGAHQDSALTAREESQGFVLTCCAVPKTPVMLESRHVTGADAFPIRKLPSRVASLERVSHDVMVVKLRLPATDSLQFHAGQYIELVLRDGTRRSYSMANAPTSGAGIELHIRHMPGGKFTEHVFGALREQELLRFEGPFGSFFLREHAAKPIVMLASGTGFAPIKALIEHMQSHSITRPAVLYWGGRRPGDLYMDAWVRQRLTEIPSLQYVPVVSDALAADGWTGRTGLVHKAVLEDFPDLKGYQVYACGAPIVVESARREYCSNAGLPAEEFYADSFITEADKKHPVFP